MIKPKQRKCIELMLLGTMTDREVAEAINVTPKTICAWKKEKEFGEEYEGMMRKGIQYAASKAFAKQQALLDSRNDMVAHLAAKDILDRSGFAGINKIDLSADMELNISIDYGEDENDD